MKKPMDAKAGKEKMDPAMAKKMLAAKAAAKKKAPPKGK